MARSEDHGIGSDHNLYDIHETFFVEYDSERDVWWACNRLTDCDTAYADIRPAVNEVKAMRILYSFRVTVGFN